MRRLFSLFRSRGKNVLQNAEVRILQHTNSDPSGFLPGLFSDPLI